MKKILFFAVLAIFFNGCSKNIGEKNHIALNSQIPIKTIFSASNKTLALEDNRPFMLFFFSSDCGACKEAIAYMNFFDEKYAENFKVIGVMGGSLGLDNDIKLLKNYDIKFKVISDAKSVDYLSRAVGGIYGVPVFYIYDKDGRLTNKYLGLTPQNKLEESVKETI
ncbi:MAG: TlpA family protein disulfide reductase [Campylobacteraceae bacterium]|jgi:thiol-disulfide isomerase/thioredoxin|nr:TlpA family protein disulfide reductase [Campylobacteraceae bacterium]